MPTIIRDGSDNCGGIDNVPGLIIATAPIPWDGSEVIEDRVRTGRTMTPSNDGKPSVGLDKVRLGNAVIETRANDGNCEATTKFHVGSEFTKFVRQVEIASISP